MTKETQHTPGPWRVVEADTRAPWATYAIVEQDGTTIVPPLNGEANARLIAAAPELLEAAEALLHNMANMHDVAQEMTNLEAAIAKARGRS